MVTTLATNLYRYFRSHRDLFVLLLSWIVGLLAGFYFFLVYEPPSFILMRSVFLQPVSIVGLISVIFLPLLCTYIFLSINKWIGILIVCFFKAAAFAFTFAWISLFFDSASWLIRFLFMFSDLSILIVLFTIWFQGVSGSRIAGMRTVGIYTSIGTLIAAADFFWVSPVLIGLF